jgi:pimeloyl-ACP methyl ester carboxylesterase
MKRFFRTLSLVAGASLGVLLIGPFLVPVPPLTGTVPAETLADPDGRFAEVNGLKVYYKLAGKGQPALLLLHGFLASLYSWREVFAPLAGTHKVAAFDRPAFGLTERPLQWDGQNPYGGAAQVELTIGLMDQLGLDKAVLVGNSAGGAIALQTALEHPERVQALVLVDPAIYTSGGIPPQIKWVFRTPQARRLGPLFVRSMPKWGMKLGQMAWHDPSKFTPQEWEGYKKPLMVNDWDRALFEMFTADNTNDLSQRLGKVKIPVLVITGEDDQIVPTAQSIRLSQELPNARLVVIPECGHVPQEERPEAFLEAVNQFLSGLE